MNIFFVPNHIFDLNHCVLIFSTSAHPCYYPYPCSYLYFDCLYIVYTSTGGGVNRFYVCPRVYGSGLQLRGWGGWGGTCSSPV